VDLKRVRVLEYCTDLSPYIYLTNPIFRVPPILGDDAES